MKTRLMGAIALAVLPLAVAACEGAPSAPETAPSPSAQGANGSLTQDEGLWAVISFALVTPGGPVTPYSNRCPDGGGGTVSSILREPAVGPGGETRYLRERTVLETHGCRYRLMRERDGRFREPGAVITVTTEPGEWVMDRTDPHYLYGHTMAVNETKIHRVGSFRWSTDDGRAGTCAVDLTFRFTRDMSTNVYVETWKGTLCGEPVDRLRTGIYGDRT